MPNMLLETAIAMAALLRAIVFAFFLFFIFLHRMQMENMAERAAAIASVMEMNARLS